MVTALAERLQRAIPDCVELASRRLRRTTTFVVKLEPQQFRIVVRGQTADAWVDHVVRDVCVRSEKVDIDTWLDGLAAALEREAKRSTITRLALEEALT